MGRCFANLKMHFKTMAYKFTVFVIQNYSNAIANANATLGYKGMSSATGVGGAEVKGNFRTHIL